jgi:hypothetical protein
MLNGYFLYETLVAENQAQARPVIAEKIAKD